MGKNIRGVVIYLDEVDVGEAGRRNYHALGELNLIPGVRVEDSFFTYTARGKSGKIELKLLAISGNLNEQAIRARIGKYGRVEFS